MNGAESLLTTLVNNGIEVCFANPMPPARLEDVASFAFRPKTYNAGLRKVFCQPDAAGPAEKRCEFCLQTNNLHRRPAKRVLSTRCRRPG